ncbi:MAG: GxxExxY protein [Ferruginibacter sp.]
MTDLILKDESYKIVGLCMEVHKALGMGFKEIIYKDALEIEFKKKTKFLIEEKRNLLFHTKGKFCHIHIQPILLHTTQ